MNNSKFSLPVPFKQFIFLTLFLAVALILQEKLVNTGKIDPYLARNIINIAISVVLAVSLNLINGFTGQFSIGHAGFMAVGAYFSAILTVNFHAKIVSLLHLGFLSVTLQNQLVFIISIIIGAIISAIIGVLIGIPTLRLRGDYLAIATLGFAQIIAIIAQNIDYVGGPRGFIDIPPYTNFTWALMVAAVTTIVIYNFTRSSHGRACVAIRENEIAAEAMGINTTKYKIIAFTIGAFFAGVGGALYAHLNSIVTPKDFSFMQSVNILVIVVAGGLGSLSGSITAAIILATFSAYMADYPEVRMILYSLLLVALMLFRPQGIFGNKEISLRIFSKLKRSDKNVVAEGK